MRWLVLLIVGVLLAVTSSYVAGALGLPRFVRALLFGGVLGFAVLMAVKDLNGNDKTRL